MKIHIKRAYEEAVDKDGVRILVDRIWPRGVSKEKLEIAHWLKEVAPSSELRKWFNHEPKKFEEFKRRYQEELEQVEESKVALETLKQIVIEEKKAITLVYGAKDKKHNQAIVLKEILEGQLM